MDEKTGRTAQTLQHAFYSPSYRERTRWVLAAYQTRYQLTSRTILNEIQDTLVDTVIKDHKEITRFLNQSEPDDPKIADYVRYLEKVFPERAGNIGEHGFAESLGEDLLRFYTGHYAKSQYDRALDGQRVSELSGLYGAPLWSSSNSYSGNMEALYIRHCYPLPVGICTAFSISLYETRFQPWYSRFSEISDRLFATLSERRMPLDAEEVGMQAHEMANVVAEAAGSSLVPRWPGDAVTTLRVWGKGLIIPDGDHGVVFLRETLRGHPVLGRFKVADRGGVYFSAANLPPFVDRTPPTGSGADDWTRYARINNAQLHAEAQKFCDCLDV